MFPEDGPPNPTEAEEEQGQVEHHASSDGKVQIVGLNHSDVFRIVAGVVEAKWDVTNMVNSKLTSAIDAAVNRLAPEVVREKLGAAIDVVIAEGIPEFDSYSGKEKKRHSIASLVVKELERKNDSYSSNSKSVLQASIESAVAKVFNAEVVGLVEEAKKKIREQVDAVLAAKLNEALKGALGIR